MHQSFIRRLGRHTRLQVFGEILGLVPRTREVALPVDFRRGQHDARRSSAFRPRDLERRVRPALSLGREQEKRRRQQPGEDGSERGQARGDDVVARLDDGPDGP